jgi:DNA-binding MarR family transcriptional regulator
MMEELISALETFRTTSKQANTGSLLVFTIIAKEPGITIGELRRKAGMTSSAASRHVSVLSDAGDRARNQPGMGLVVWHTDGADARIKRCTLTDRGAELANKMWSLNNDR